MSSKILAIVNQKGGVGKTTTAVNLAHGLALRGRRTLLIDLDGQGNVADSLGLKKGNGIYRLLIDREIRVVASSGRKGLDWVSGGKETAVARENLVGRVARERALALALQDLRDRYEWIILDVAPGTDLLQTMALVACDGFLIPVALDHLAAVGARDALQSALTLRELGLLTGRFLGVLATMWERTTAESRAQMQELAKTYGRLLWPPIPLDTRVRESAAHGQTLWEYAPGTRALVGVALNGGHLRTGGYEAALERLEREL